MSTHRCLWLCVTITRLGLSVHAQPDPTYPRPALDAEQIADQVSLVIHRGLLRI
jgi:hypothetical protein